MANDPALAAQVADFLLAEEGAIAFGLNRLDFYVESFHVDPEGYREIGHKIRQGAIEVAAASRSGGDSRIGAAYTALRNRLSLPPTLDLSHTSSQSIQQQAMIVHEVTHALMDYHHFQTSGTVQEVTAYIAETLYAAARSTRIGASQHPPSDAIFTAAREIVFGRNMKIDLGQRLVMTDTDVAALASAVRAHPDYRDADGHTRSDGISGGLINPWYEPRHR